MNLVPLSLYAYQLSSTIRHDWNVGAEQVATGRDAVESESVILVVQGQTTTRRAEDLDVAASTSSLWCLSQYSGQGTAKWKGNLTAGVLGDGYGSEGASRAVCWWEIGVVWALIGRVDIQRCNAWTTCKCVSHFHARLGGLGKERTGRLAGGGTGDHGGN